MALYKVDSDTADLTKVAGGTLYADLPIGSWIKNDMATIPSGFLKEGDTISQSEYPELYAKYGPTVPYKADTSELSEYENITLSTNSSNPTVMPYDGVYILANYGVQTIHHIYLNGVEISSGITGNNTTGASTSSTILFKKGDTMYRLNTYTEATFLEHVAYYKKSLIVKAKHTPVPADFMDAIDDAISDITVDTVADRNMHAVTSNAVAESQKWKDLNGNSIVGLDYNELAITAWINRDGTANEILFAQQYAREMLSLAQTPQVLMLGGYYIESSDYGLCNLNNNRGVITIRNFYYAGENYTSSAHIRIRYR